VIDWQLIDYWYVCGLSRKWRALHRERHSSKTSQWPQLHREWRQRHGRRFSSQLWRKIRLCAYAPPRGHYVIAFIHNHNSRPIGLSCQQRRITGHC